MINRALINRHKINTMSVRDQLVRAVYRAGWWGAGRLPQAVIDPLVSLGGRVAVQRDGRHLRTLRHNLALTTGRPVDDDLARAAMESYLRTFVEVVSLPRWAPDRVLSTVRIVNEPVLREVVRGRGAVVALPHSANWDLAGAWAVSTGMPVTTIAEQLPDADYEAFVAFRRGLGIEVLSHRDPRGIARLIEAIGERRVVCLIADRDLSGAGVEVSWAGHPVRLPAGPAIVARRSGAALLPAVCAYVGESMVITIGDPVEPRPGRDGLVAMTQQVADFFVDRIRRHPQDWHLLQPFFDRDPIR